MTRNVKAARPSNWHKQHWSNLSFGDKLADAMAAFVGSWTFVLVLSLFIVVWIATNVLGFLQHWDPFPFILLNLLFSAQATYSTPLIMMAQNRSADRDRANAQHDYEVNEAAKQEIEELMQTIKSLELNKLDKILEILRATKAQKPKRGRR